MVDPVMFYDLVLLLLFVVFLSWFLYSRKKNLKREGLLYLYRAKWGIKLINYIGKKYKKTLKLLSYVSIASGFILMISMVYLFGKIIWVYVFQPAIVQQIKIPPILPLVPYLPQVFKLDFLPPFYFTYWIIILAIVAVTHEFAHGIFMKRYGIHIKSTGFGFFPWFLPVFLAAFVEQDERSMKKAGKFEQMSVLAAGTLANVITAIFALFLLWGFFSLAYAPAGVQYDNYAYNIINVSLISSINGISVDNPTVQEVIDFSNESGWNVLEYGERDYLIKKDILEGQNNSIIAAYYDSPAARNEILGAIVEINGEKVISIEDLGEEISKYSVGDEITIKTVNENDETNYRIKLESSPNNAEKPWIGVSFVNRERSGIMGKIYEIILTFRNPNVYYESNFDAADYVYNLIWWLVLISISVALVNMLPVGIFDGGMFFYLSVLGITKSEKIASRVFAFVTYLFLLCIALLMFFWFIAIF